MKKFKEIDNLFFDALKNEVFTGAAVLASKNGKVSFFETYGKTSAEGDKITRETFFDLASLTKPLATTIFFQLLWQKKKISPEDNVSYFYNEWKTDTYKKNIKISNLLLHDSGLPAHRKFYEKIQDIEFKFREKSRMDMISKEALEHIPGSQTLYSDLGFMVLKYVLEKIAGESMYEYLKKNIYDYSESGLFFPSLKKSDCIKFCETSFSCFRNKRLTGEVNDENAFFIGGEDGHAGLFGNCMDINNLLREIFCSYKGFKSCVLKSSCSREILKNRKNKRYYGFDITSKIESSAGSFFTDKSPGHLGYTGTSFWMDLEKGLWIILLTNRVYYGDNNFKIKIFRPLLHDRLINLV
ncbi:MAG: hypothetical protein CSA18_00950 [Deltaproteobacteria bacterium]|nr:MAG: hypothetical protein CSA18_00950 [Deltaproteobacteria bacterium]